MTSSEHKAMWLGVAAIVIVIVAASMAVRHRRLQQAFYRGDAAAIARTAKMGRSLVPRMLEGLSDDDPQYREACRAVLYHRDMWRKLTDAERREVATGQFHASLAAISKQGTYFTLDIETTIPYKVEMYGEEVYLEVNGRRVADFGHLYTSISSGRRFTTSLDLPHVEEPFLRAGDQLALVGRVWYRGKDDEYVPLEGRPPHPSAGFYLPWRTPPVTYSPDDLAELQETSR